jgi:hypothetical protein
MQRWTVVKIHATSIFTLEMFDFMNHSAVQLPVVRSYFVNFNRSIVITTGELIVRDPGHGLTVRF